MHVKCVGVYMGANLAGLLTQARAPLIWGMPLRLSQASTPVQCRLLKDLAGEDADTRCSVVAVEARATAQRLVSIHGRAQLMACVWRPSTDCLGPSKQEIFERFERSVC